MLALIPAENWEYSLRDAVSGLMSVIITGAANNDLNIDGIGKCIPTRSARAAIYTAVKALNLSTGARIGVPLYCCPVVFKAIEAAGYKHCFIDIDYATYCMAPEDLARKINGLDAIVAVHMFGNTCDMPTLMEAAQGKPVIEDCAQSLGSRINGRMTGTFGTIAAFSFRSGKYLTVGEGGALFSNQQTFIKELTSKTSMLPTPGIVDELVHLAKTYMRTKLRTKPLYGLIGYPLWQFYNRTTDYISKSPIILSRMYKSDLSITRERLKCLNVAIQKQRSFADLYSRTLILEPSMLSEEKPHTYYNRYLYPILFQSISQRDFVAARLHEHSIVAAKPYHDIAEVAVKHYGYKGDCPISEQVAKRILVIPNYHKLKENDVMRIAQCLNEVFEEINLS